MASVRAPFVALMFIAADAYTPSAHSMFRVTSPCRVACTPLRAKVRLTVQSSEQFDEQSKRPQVSADAEEPAASAPSENSSFFATVSSMARRYGAAGALSLVIETVIFWLVFILPATAFMFHQSSGMWIPHGATAVSSFWSAAGGVWL